MVKLVVAVGDGQWLFHAETLVVMDTWLLNDRPTYMLLNFSCCYQKSIDESIGQSMAYCLSSFIGIGIANTFFMNICIGIDYTFQKYC